MPWQLCKKTKIFVATGIMVCILGLAFIAMSGRAALSEGFGSDFELSHLSFWKNEETGQCIAVKGSQTCYEVGRATSL